MSLAKAGLIVVGVGAIAYAGYNYYKIQTSMLSNSNYEIDDITIQNITLSTLSLNIRLKLDNASDINVTLQDLYLDIFLDGKNVGFILQTIQSVIPPKGTAIIPLNASVSISSAIESLANKIGQLFSGKRTIDIKAVGHVSIKSGLVSTSAPVSFEKQIAI